MIVVDASVLVPVLIDDGEDGDLARARLLDDPDLHAPHLVDLEVLSALRRRTKKTDVRRLRLALSDLEDLTVTRYPHLPFAGRILELRDNLTVYDAAYVALAEALRCTLVTADSKLGRASGPECDVEVLNT